MHKLNIRCVLFIYVNAALFKLQMIYTNLSIS